MQRLKALLPLLKNRFVLVGLVFLVWMVFFDSNDLISQYKYKRKLRQLEENKNFYLEQIELVKQDKEELFTNLKKLEKFAREKYKMKRDDEDLYIVLREK
jgi:cell division protein FtsB